MANLPIIENLDKIQVSKIKQTAVATAAAAALQFNLDPDSQLILHEYREHDQGLKSGYVEPSEILKGVFDVDGTLKAGRVRPAFLAWLFSQWCDNHSEAAAGATGYVHTSKVVTEANGGYLVDPAYFTLIHQKGNIADTQQFIGNTINTYTLGLKRGDWMSASVGIKGIGYVVEGTYREVIAGLNNATSLTLAKEVQGDTVDNIRVLCDYDEDGIYERVIVPTNIVTKTLTIPSQGGDGLSSRNYLACYLVKNTEAGYTQFDLSGVSHLPEFAVRINNIKIGLFGIATESAFSQGQTAGVELESLELTGDKRQEVIKSWRAGDTVIDYATGVQNGNDILQTLKIERQTIDRVLQAYGKYGQTDMSSTYFSVWFEALGPAYESGQSWKFQCFLPKVGITGYESVLSGGKWIERAEMVVMPNGTSATSIFKTWNQVTGYLA